MYCKICNNFFQPTPDTEKLIVSGNVEEVCDPCAAKKWAKSVENEVLPPPVYPGTEYKGDGQQLYRADWFKPGGTHRAFIAMPPRPLRPPPSPLRPRKLGNLHVSIMSEHQHFSERRLTEPAMTIRTNLERFREWDPPVLWIQKVPDCYDGFTGVGRIEIPAGHVADVTRTGRQVNIKLTDGDSIRLLHR